MQLNATLGNLDDTLRLCMDLSMLPPPAPSTKGGSTSSAGSELDESCTAAHSPPSAAAANTTVAAANETFSGKMMIDINEVSYYFEYLYMLIKNEVNSSCFFVFFVNLLSLYDIKFHFLTHIFTLVLVKLKQ